MKRFKIICLILISLCSFSMFSLASTSALSFKSMAADENLRQDACTGLSQVDNNNPADNCSGAAGGGIDDVVHAALNILAIVVGIAAVIMIVLSGFKYITSGGDANKVGSAKTTLIYALIGLVVVTLCATLSRFVITAANNASTTCQYNSNLTAGDPDCQKPKS